MSKSQPGHHQIWQVCHVTGGVLLKIGSALWQDRELLRADEGQTRWETELRAIFGRGEEGG